MENELISVVVPVYNMGMYLPRAVDCLLSQSYNNYEIILVDDGSTDDSSAICDEYATKYEGVRVVHKPNGGLSSARNAGIDNAIGKYIIFPDPDDWTDPSYLATFMTLHEKYQSDLEICGHYISSDNGEFVHNTQAQEVVLNRQDALELLMSSKAFCGFAWNKLYHLDIIRDNGLLFDTELGMAQDLHFAFRYLLAADKIAYNPTPCYHYFQHAGGVTHTKTPLTPRKLSGLKTYIKIAELAKEDFPKAEAMALSTIFNMSMHFMYIFYDSHDTRNDVLADLIENLKKYQAYFFANPHYSVSHKLLGKMALIHPRLYYLMKKALLH